MYPNQNDLSAWNLGNQPPQGQFPGGPGYPMNPPGAYPGYPQQGPGIPGGQPGYPTGQPGYPGGQAGYPGPQPGYPGGQPGYPAGQPCYAGGQPSYPGGQPAYPGAQQGYPGGQQMGYQGGQPMGGFQQAPPGGAKPVQQTDYSGTVAPTPTLRPFPHFNAEQDCERLRKAMKGLGTDEKAIIDVLSHRTADQRAQLVIKFKTMYGKDLIKDLKSELSGHFEEIAEMMCYPLDELDARELRRAMQGAGTDEETLIEILVSRSNAQIRKIKEQYHRLYPGRDLEKDLRSETHGHFERILVSLAQGNRDENPHVDQNAVAADVEKLYQAGEGRLGTDESTFNRILVAKSKPHVRAVIEAYGRRRSRDIEEALKSEMSGDLLRSFLAIVRCIRNEPKYFAYELHKAMRGAGTRDHRLIRLVVTRAEIDMADIKREYQKAHGKSLESAISSDTSGDYKRMLLALVSQ